MSPTRRRLSALLRPAGCRSPTSGLLTTAEEFLSASNMARSRDPGILARISCTNYGEALLRDTVRWFPNRHPIDSRQRTPRIAGLQQPQVPERAVLAAVSGTMRIHRQQAHPDHRVEAYRLGRRQSRARLPSGRRRNPGTPAGGRKLNMLPILICECRQTQDTTLLRTVNDGILRGICSPGAQDNSFVPGWRPRDLPAVLSVFQPERIADLSEERNMRGELGRACCVRPRRAHRPAAGRHPG